MNDIQKILLNAKEVEFLTGVPMPLKVHADRMDKKSFNESTMAKLNNLKYTVEDIDPYLKHTSSNDPRYDNMPAITFAITQVREKGLNRNVREDILSDKGCIKNQSLAGQYFFLNSILTAVQLDEITSALQAKYKYHTQKQEDLMGGSLPEFINFGAKTVLASIKDYTPKRKKNGTKGSRKTA